MYQLNLNHPNNLFKVKVLLSKWTDDSKVTSPLVIVRISQAFSMYHQISSVNLVVHHRSWKNLHPVLINDLDTNLNVLLILNTNGKIIHYYLINDQGRLTRKDSLKRISKRKANQEYLDYFYVIAKNIEGCVNLGNP